MPDVRGALAAGRRAAESRMLSRCTSWRPQVDENGIPVTTTNDDGFSVPAWEVPNLDLPCRLTARTGAGQSRTISTPGGDIEVASRELHVPSWAYDIKDGDLFEITWGENEGTVWQVIEADGADQTTALRLPVISVQRPEEW